MLKVWIKVKVNCIAIGDKGVADKAGTVHGIPKAKFFIWGLSKIPFPGQPSIAQPIA
jgi:hypothetical protein